MKFAVLSLYTQEIAIYGVPTAANKRAYADSHGYQFCGASESLDRSRPPAWSKLLMCQRAMAGADWLFWSDADAVITNFAVQLETRIDEKADFLYTCDMNGINTGAFLMRSCEASRRLIELAWERVEFINDPWWEQRALSAVLSADLSGVRKKVLPKRMINSYENDWRPGDFLIHFPGYANRADRVLRALRVNDPQVLHKERPG